MYEIQNPYKLPLDTHLPIFTEKPEEFANNISWSQHIIDYNG
jgi:hypothetical protein